MFIANQDDFILKHRINLGDVFNQEKEEDVFVVLKEPKSLDFIRLNDTISNAGKEDGTKLFEKIVELLPKVIVEHNLYKDEKNILNNEEVVDFISCKTEALTKLVNEYSEKVLFLLIGDKKKLKK